MGILQDIIEFVPVDISTDQASKTHSLKLECLANLHLKKYLAGSHSRTFRGIMMIYSAR